MTRYLVADEPGSLPGVSCYLWPHLFPGDREAHMRFAFDTYAQKLVSAWQLRGAGWTRLAGNALIDVEEDVLQNYRDFIDDGTLYGTDCLPEWAMPEEGRNSQMQMAFTYHGNTIRPEE